MKKQDLKTGMIVVTQDDVVRLVIGNSLMSLENGGIYLNWLDNDMLSIIGHDKYCNIISIYSEPFNKAGLCASFKFWFNEDKQILNYCTLLWERGDSIKGNVFDTEAIQERIDELTPKPQEVVKLNINNKMLI